MVARPRAWAAVGLAILIVSGCGASTPPATPRGTASALPPTGTPATSASATPTTSATATPDPTPDPSPSSPAAPASSPVTLFGAYPAGRLQQADATRLQATLDGMVDLSRPDIVAAVVTPGGTWAGATGIDGPGGRQATTADTFAIASVSKLIEAALVMRLVDEGRIDLDAPLQPYLGTIPVDANGGTVREFLAMHSGIGDTLDAARAAALATCGHAATRDEVIASFPSPFAAPGTTYQYSNPTYKLLGWAAEKASGQSLAQALQREVLVPAGVAKGIELQGAGTTTPTPWALPTDHHTGVLQLDDFGKGGALPCLSDATLSLGASGLAADMPSLARWGWELFAGRVVSQSSLQAMVDATRASTDEYGLGMETWATFGSDEVFGHSGSKDGYKAILAIVPERRIVIALGINDGDADEVGTVQQLLDALPKD